MPKYIHPDVNENGLNYIKNNCNKVAAVLSYTLLDSYATVMAAGNLLAEATMASGDFTLGISGNNPTITTAAGKQDASANNTGDPTHFAFVDTVNSKVLWVTTESGSQTITAGNSVTFPSLVHTINQPT